MQEDWFSVFKSRVTVGAHIIRAPEKPHSVRIHALEPQIHTLDFQLVHEIYPLKSIGLVRSENSL